MKFALDDLSPDINYPGLMVCGTPGHVSGKGSWSGTGSCSDAIDPYRLPPRETEDITLTMPRPDTRLPLPGYVSVAPGDANWPTTTFLGGNGAAQKPPTGT